MKREIARPYPDGRCFYCGPDNPQGLGLRFYHDEATAETSTEYLPEERFVGQGDILHGAIQMGLLDELMGWACYVHTGEMAVTTDMRFKFRRPLYIAGTPVRAACRVTGRDGPKVHMVAELVDAVGVVCLTATGTYHILPPERFEAVVRAKPPVSG
ncbi:MAG: PaaI family thioesterase [Solidesulfovibrio sp. DCME]|uniref:PaaI family thioesterase n=1 Tax=Solidesulfovibrio sp. DCME TaxID=3447380 RepID=UPI003D0EF7A5